MTIIDHKNTNLSSKVQETLFVKGYSQIFNWVDYFSYKNQTADKIFRAEAIAELFIQNTSEISDYADYEF
ncbi:hypothetical protein [Chryseobacterium luquanense]|uniref:Uncharacterized protein n=1 Tax=Chryseobacterium luquanense TaxID=2983766 RepID=A0ABT3Y4M3_9FLAO|nr:hypothetical protein [Chryseobacterium luquanense]MCX8533112.1 hypothetical protein [Chryseobacterium luquanense]